MRCEVASFVDRLGIIKRIDDEFGLMDNYGGDGLTKLDVVESFSDKSIMVKAMSDSNTLLGVAILEMVQDNRSASIHFAMFETFNIKKAFALMLDLVGHRFDIIYAYIKPDRSDIALILKMLNFKLEQPDQGWIYGWLEKETKTKKTCTTNTCDSAR